MPGQIYANMIIKKYLIDFDGWSSKDEGHHKASYFII